jgi:sialic acid synthase SpsE/sugar phosphate isomerase/epimerase
MIIDKKISKYIVFCEDSIRNSLKKIESNKAKTVFAVTEDNRILGVLTDGDFRRWILDDSIHDHDLSLPVESIINRNFKYLHVNESPDRIRQSLSQAISILPLIDDHFKLQSVARIGSEEISIGDFVLDESSPSFIIAEIGNNHNGDFELAKKLIDLAKKSGADCAKFQMRDLLSLYNNQGNVNDASEDLGSQYTLDLLNKFQLSNEDLFKLFDYCKELEILPLCTPWDEKSFMALEAYGMEAYKIASADFTNHEFIKLVATSGKPLICSTGMTNESEIINTVKVLQEVGAQYILLHCNSTYPAPFKDINLAYLKRLKDLGNCLVGYSGHERGYHIPLASIALGAKVIEKHFTVDKTMEGNDHKVSLLPEEFREMVTGIRQVEDSLGEARNRIITQGELMNRETLGKSLVCNQEIVMGEVILSNMITTRSPGKGLAPYFKKDLIGKVAKRNFSKGDFFFPSDLSETAIEIKNNYSFTRPWGLPVRFHDFNSMVKLSSMKLVEFHLSYKDLELNINDFLSGTYDVDFVVHTPELFEGDHLLDLCSNDESYRQQSIKHMQRVIDVTKSLKVFFPKMKSNPLIVTNVGGFSNDYFLPNSDKTKLYENYFQSLKDLNLDGVEIIPQTMPPFPWHFGGQRYHNLFMSFEDIQYYCDKYKIRVCLDISHSKLACNQFHWSFTDFIEKISPYIAHMHVVDASGVDGEGLQIGEGEIDFFQLARLLRESSPKASFIPEIWQGHKNQGEGFWVALSRLEKFNF